MSYKVECVFCPNRDFQDNIHEQMESDEIVQCPECGKSMKFIDILW